MTGSVVQHRVRVNKVLKPTLLNMKIFPSDSSRCCSSPYLYLVTSSRSCSNQQIVLTQGGRWSSGAQEQPTLTEHGSLSNKYSAECKWCFILSLHDAVDAVDNMEVQGRNNTDGRMFINKCDADATRCKLLGLSRTLIPASECLSFESPSGQRQHEWFCMEQV